MSALESSPSAPSRAPLRRAVALLLPLLTSVSAGTVDAATGPWQENEQSRVRLVSPWDRAPHPADLEDGDALRLGLEFEVIPGWHVYWKNSGDAGFPPALDLSPSPGVASSDILFPAPERYDLRGGLVAFGYEDHVVYPVSIDLEGGADPAGSLSPGPLNFRGELDYLVCEVDCIPYSYTVTLEQPLAPPGGEPERAASAAEVEGWWERLPRRVEELAGVSSGGELDLADPEAPRLMVELRGIRAVEGSRPELFLEPQETFDVGRPELETLDDGLRFRVPLSFLQVPDELPREAAFAWTVTGLAPRNGSGDAEAGTDATSAVEARRTVPAVGTDRRAEAGVGAAEAEGTGSAGGWDAGSLPGAFLGGLLLALTPALLALLGLRWLALRHLSGAGVRRGALATAGGLVVGMWLVAAAGRAADLPTWGAQLQEPVLVTALILITLGLSLSCWRLLAAGGDRTPDDPPTPAVRPEAGGVAAGLVGAFLALSWNAPYLGEVVGPALDGGPLPALLVATALGSGLALPWLALALAPRLLAPLRRLDDGARGLRESLGFLALLGVLWLLYLLHGLVTQEGLALIELGLVAVGLLAWGRATASRRFVSWALGLLLLATAGYVLYLATESRQVQRASAAGEGRAVAIAAAAAALPAAPGSEAPGPDGNVDGKRQL